MINRVEYTQPKVYNGKCTNCGKDNIAWDYNNKIKAGTIGIMYCQYCRVNTHHTNIKEIKE